MVYQRSNPTDKMISDLRIMIVDDNPIDMHLIYEILNKQGFQRFLMYPQARTALDYLLTENRMELLPDVVILDQMLGNEDISSTQFCDQVFRLDKGMPIICLTGHKSFDALVNMKDYGVSDFAFKPLTDPKNASDLQSILKAAARIASFEGRKIARFEGLKNARLRFRIA